MTRVLLIRHGETWANRRGEFAGFTDAVLTELGMEQAEKTAEFVLENYKVDKVYASDLQRAFNTAKAIADKLGIEVIPEKGMREIFGGLWEDVPYVTLVERYPEAYRTWLHDIGKSVCTEGESTVELGERVFGTVKRIASENEGKTVVIATHATPVRVTQTLIQYGDLENMQSVPWASNASVTELICEDGVWSVVKASMDEHLGDMKTVLPDDV